ncbi:hypothetical protein [Microbacterium sp. SD291]|uniref:hypothetical protein n=1 Tax=Microbacterium sp. SD291 TaxID=2782007 RepID=UPI001A960B4A|nr:hypothetical protein [Microbacterium sp. SD291]MBO0980772.1 hypothetical protein [Microbacterium sp. SD291]
MTSPIEALETVMSLSSSESTAVLDEVANVSTDESGSAAIEAEVNDVEVIIPTSASDPISLTFATGSAFAVDLPAGEQSADASALEPGVVAFDAGTFTTIPVVKDDGSVQIATVLDGPESPTAYEYGITIAGGGSLSLTDEGVVLVTGADGKLTGAVAPAWALDADGRNVPTRYEVQGDTLVQIVDHTEGSFSYPIVADPWMGGNLFDRMNTGSWNSQPRYSLFRSTWGAVVSGYATATPIFLSAGWSEAVSRWPVLTSKETLHQQYDCHAFYAILKPDSWNLEKARSNNSGWGSTIASHWCNW